MSSDGQECSNTVTNVVSAIPAVDPSSDPPIVTREEWGAKAPKLKEPMPNPVPFVVIHHSYHPSACYDKENCIRAMKWMQDFHQIDRDWNDIGYSFAVGGDGRIYEGRGWSSVGAHAPRYNDKSIGICIIGDWRYELPPKNQLDAVKELIAMGVRNRKIDENYRMVGHRQVRDTECPGGALFSEIETWPHFTIDTTFKPSPTLEPPPLKEPTMESNHSSTTVDPGIVTTLEHQKPDIREGIDDVLLPEVDSNKLRKRGLINKN